MGNIIRILYGDENIPIPLRYRQATKKYLKKLNATEHKDALVARLDYFGIVILNRSVPVYEPDTETLINNVLSIEPGEIESRDVIGIEQTDDLENDAQIADIPDHIKKIKAHMAWERCEYGRGIKVAVLDTGIKELDTVKIADGVSYIGSNRDDYNDDAGHGTLCAAIIAAQRKEGVLPVGVAPEALLFAVKVLDYAGNGTTDSVLQGMYWAYCKNMDVVSMSLAEPFPSRPYDEYTRAVEVLRTIGCAVVAGTGNSGTSVLAPANSPGVIAVGKIKHDGTIFPESCYGAIERFKKISNEVTVVAKGIGIDTFNLKGEEVTRSGTSVSCAQVAGLIALMKRRFQLRIGDCTIDNLGELVDYLAAIIKDTSCSPKELDDNPEGCGNPYGSGLIDCDKATQLTGSSNEHYNSSSST